jgi:short chain dehydrogenase
MGILRTGMVGKAFAARLTELGHEVLVGSRDPAATLARGEPDRYGNPPFRVWSRQHPGVKLGSLADAAELGELVVNATAGEASPDALRLAGEADLADGGRTCLVTGTTSGIGKATTTGLARLGAEVVPVARDPAKGRATVEEIQAPPATRGWSRCWPTSRRRPRSGGPRRSIGAATTACTSWSTTPAATGPPGTPPRTACSGPSRSTTWLSSCSPTCCWTCCGPAPPPVSST